ncbi:MAG TPA: ATP-binding protein [Planctomycetota bacterium]|nr:ATP-binding protein [Planctomycetota bacterium]
MTRPLLLPRPAGPRASGTARAIAAVLTLVSAAALLGRLFDVGWLHSPLGASMSMGNHAAAGFLLFSGALWRMPRSPRSARFGYVLLGLWGGLHLVQQLANRDLGLDRLFGEAVGPDTPAAAPMDMEPAAALCFLVLGLGGSLSVRGRGWRVVLGHGLVFVTATIALVCLVENAHGVDRVYWLESHAVMTFPTGLCFFIGALGTLLSRRDHGLGRLLSLPTPAGDMLRSALPAAILIPLLIGWLTLLGTGEHWYSVEFATGVAAVLTAAVMLLVLMVVTARARETESTLMLRDRALESTQVAVVIVDARAHDLPIVETNAAFENITGYTFAEVAGRNCRFLNARARDQQGLETVRNALRNHEACEVVLQNHRKDGTPFWNRLAISPVRDAFGDLTHFVGIIRDVSQDVARQQEREQLLAATRNAQSKAEQALGARDEFLGMVSHELRSPLHSARLWASLLIDGGSQIAPAEVAAHLVKSIDAQTRLVADLIDVSRASNDGLDLELTVQDLRPLVATTIEHLAPLAGEKQVTIVADLPHEGIRARLDPDRFAQVVRNLVENAIKYTPAGGTVRVRLATSGERALVQVADTGCGISRAEQPRVFEKFWQSVERPGRRPGLGLGLTIVKHLVEKHGGTIEVQSQGPGRGTTFSVELPLASEASVVATKAPRQLPVSGATRRAMVVDDDESARVALANILAGHGWQVDSAGSAEQARTLLVERSYGLLVSDIMLPDASGLQLIQQLRAMPSPLAQPAAIAVSGQDSPADRRNALDAGFDAFLSKPVVPESLLALIAAITSPPDEPTPVRATDPGASPL